MIITRNHENGRRTLINTSAVIRAEERADGRTEVWLVADYVDSPLVIVDGFDALIEGLRASRRRPSPVAAVPYPVTLPSASPPRTDP